MTRFTPILRLPTAILAFSFVKVSEPIITGYFEVKCPFRYPHVYWIRDSQLVVETSWVSSPRFTEDGNDLQAITNVSFFAWGKHKLQVNIDHQDNETYWQCCIFFAKICIDGKLVKGSQNEDGTMMLTTSSPDSTEPEMNGTLKLASSAETPMEGQSVTLSCNIDTDIDAEKWVVLWVRNDIPVLITNDSSVVSEQKLIDILDLSVNESKGIEETFDNGSGVFHNVRVSTLTDKRHQNITFPASSSLIGRSYWNCGNPFVMNLSNTVIIDVIPLSNNSGEPLTSTYMYIIAGSVCGVVVVILVVVTVMILLRWRRKKENNDTVATKKKNNDAIKEDVVMTENVLYEGNRDNKGYQKEELVMEDNVLYVG